MGRIAANLHHIRTLMAAACRRAGREVDSVQLIAVSKTFPAAAVCEACEAGQSVFGESKLQEAEPKIAESPLSARWHFIGRLQRNKLRKILQNFDTLHAVDSKERALQIDSLANELGIFPQVFLQVNIATEPTKGGFVPRVLETEFEFMLGLKRVELVGLMTIPPDGQNPERSRPWFSAVREFRDRLEAIGGVRLPSLSMGMSGDFEVAIEEGATHLRIGSAVFGKRPYRVDGELGGPQFEA
jgi:PLP dependent protein